MTRFGTTTNGQFDPLAQFGGSLIQDHAITKADGASHDFAAGNGAGRGDDRRPPPYAAALRPPLRRRGAGRRLLGAGRLTAFNNFMTFLGAPPRGAVTADVNAGEQVFGTIGCTACHTPTLHSGHSDVAAFDNVPFHPYSDFLIHDMGPLGDGIAMGKASGREFRTAPLWGLPMITRFLHDGRAATLDAAILGHDGQGRAARDAFAALDAGSREKLMAFLNSL